MNNLSYLNNSPQNWHGKRSPTAGLCMSLCMAYSTGPAVTLRHLSQTSLVPGPNSHLLRISSAKSAKNEWHRLLFPLLLWLCPKGGGRSLEEERTKFRHWVPMVKCSRCSITYLKRLQNKNT